MAGRAHRRALQNAALAPEMPRWFFLPSKAGPVCPGHLAHPLQPRCQSAPLRRGPPRSPAQCPSGATAGKGEWCTVTSKQCGSAAVSATCSQLQVPEQLGSADASRAGIALAPLWWAGHPPGNRQRRTPLATQHTAPAQPGKAHAHLHQRAVHQVLYLLGRHPDVEVDGQAHRFLRAWLARHVARATLSRASDSWPMRLLLCATVAINWCATAQVHHQHRLPCAGRPGRRCGWA